MRERRAGERRAIALGARGWMRPPARTYSYVVVALRADAPDPVG